MDRKHVPFWHHERVWYAMRVLPLLALLILLGGIAPHRAPRLSARDLSGAAGTVQGKPNDAFIHALGLTTDSAAIHGIILLPAVGQQTSVHHSGAADPAARAREKYYIGNRNTKIFHRPSCHYLPAKKNRVTFRTREAAIHAGYRPCKKCKP